MCISTSTSRAMATLLMMASASLLQSISVASAAYVQHDPKVWCGQDITARSLASHKSMGSTQSTRALLALPKLTDPSTVTAEILAFWFTSLRIIDGVRRPAAGIDLALLFPHVWAAEFRPVASSHDGCLTHRDTETTRLLFRVSESECGSGAYEQN